MNFNEITCMVFVFWTRKKNIKLRKLKIENFPLIFRALLDKVYSWTKYKKSLTGWKLKKYRGFLISKKVKFRRGIKSHYTVVYGTSMSTTSECKFFESCISCSFLLQEFFIFLDLSYNDPRLWNRVHGENSGWRS